MKKLKYLIKSFILLSLLVSLFSCDMGSNSSDKNNDDDNGKSTDTVQFLRFNAKNASVLGVVDKDEKPNASARSAATDALIVKIQEDGSFKSFLSLPEGTQGELESIHMIVQSPDPDMDCFYVVFDASSGLRTPVTKSKEYTNEDGEVIVETWEEDVPIIIGPILCVLPDGSYRDFVKLDEPGIRRRFYSDLSGPVSVDSKGNIYYLVLEFETDDAHTYANPLGDTIYKYNPRTDEVTKLTIPDKSIYYKKLQVSADGEWLFVDVQKRNGSTYTNYLRAIPASKPESYIDIFHDDNGASVFDWVYDDDENCLYYVIGDGIHKVPRTSGTFSTTNDTLLFTESTGKWSYNGENGLFEDLKEPQFIYSLKTKGSFNPNLSEQLDVCKLDGEDLVTTGEQQTASTKVYTFKNSSSEVQVQEVYEFILDKANESICLEKLNEIVNPYILEQEVDGKKKYVYKSRLNDKYYISFKKFADDKGFEQLATVTEGKTDFEAIKAIFDNNLEGLFASLIDVNIEGSPYKNSGNNTSCYFNRNFYADILYNKDGDDKDKPISPDLLTKSAVSPENFNSPGILYLDIFNEPIIINYTWKSDLKNGDSVDAKKVLEKLAEICEQEEIDFKLTAFKDDENYSSLYTDKTNEEAIKFLDTPENIYKLASYLSDINDIANYNPKFLNVTCFIKGTDETAFKMLTPGENIIVWRNLVKLTPSYQKSLYSVENIIDGSMRYDSFVELVDENGKRTGIRPKLEGSPKFHVVSTYSADNGVYFLNGIDLNGSETGKHNILYYDVVKNELTDLFKDKSELADLEVLSFTAGKNALYFSAVKGFTIINGKIDTTTGAYTQLSAGQKLTKMIIVK